MATLDEILRKSFEGLTKEELITLVIVLVEDGLHRQGPKPKEPTLEGSEK